MADTDLDYSANLSSAMHEMMQSMNGEDDDGSGHVSDEDEYVLL